MPQMVPDGRKKERGKKNKRLCFIQSSHGNAIGDSKLKIVASFMSAAMNS